MRAILLATMILLLILPNGGQSQADEVYDTGFRPQINGFGFQNWGRDVQSAGMTASGMRRMFGDAVCTSIAGSKIILSPPARVWMEEANKAMAYGHCEGMAVLSPLMYMGSIEPGSFGAIEASRLSFQNAELQKEIAYWWVTQVTHPGNSRIVMDSPNKVTDILIDAFRSGSNVSEWWTLGLTKPDGSGGHAITPFAVQNNSNGTARILVYDNNIPGATRAVEINRTSNTWSYLASVNPKEPSALYTGNESTKNLMIISIPPRMERQDCYWCNNESTNVTGTRGALVGREMTQFWADGNASLLVTDKDSQRTGHLLSGEFVNEIPDAEAIFLRFLGSPGTIEHEPVITVLQDGQVVGSLTGKLDGGSSDLTQIGPGYAAQVQDIVLNLGEVAHMELSLTGDVIDVLIRTDNLPSARSVNLVLGVTTLSGECFTFTIMNANIEQDGTLGLHFNPNLSVFSFDTSGNSNPSQLKIAIERIIAGSTETRVFANGDYSLKENDKVIVDLNSYDGSSYDIQVQNGEQIVSMTLQDDPALHPAQEGNGNSNGYEEGNPLEKPIVGPNRSNPSDMTYNKGRSAVMKVIAHYL